MKPRISARKKHIELDILLPSSIFYDRRLSFLESIVVYLKEVHKLSYHEIALQTNRDERNIWTIYQRAVKKLGSELLSIPVEIPLIFIPLSVVKDRTLSILEIVVYYLKLQTSLTNHQIAILLNRSDKTIHTAYSRARQKKNE